MDTRPLLLQLGGEESFRQYKQQFHQMYQASEVIDVLNNRVEFAESACHHVCFKGDEEDRYSRSRRENWSQERAERIGWIKVALTGVTTEVRPDRAIYNRLNYLLIVDADPERQLPQEFYCVVAERIDARTVTFITAFPLDHQGWAGRRRAGKALSPTPNRNKRRGKVKNLAPPSRNNRSNPPGGYDFLRISPLSGSKALPVARNPGCPTAPCGVSTDGQVYYTTFDKFLLSAIVLTYTGRSEFHSSGIP